MVEIVTKIEPDKNLKTIAKELQWFLATYQGYYFEIKSQSLIEGKPFLVSISSVTIGKLLYSGGHHKFSCLFQIREIIEQGIFDRKEEPKRENKFQIATWWFKTIVRINTEKYEFFFSVKEFVKEDKKLYSGHLDIKKPL